MNNSRARFMIFTVLILGLFLALVVQLAKLTIVDGETYSIIASELEEREINVSGVRGSILDRNGLPLAYDQKSYNVQFYRDPLKKSEAYRAYYTAIIIDTIKLVEENDGETIDTFAIRYDAVKDVYFFDWGDIKEKFKESRELKWRENMYVSTKKDEEEENYLVAAEEIYMDLRSKYQIPSEMSYEEARKVLSIWQEVQLASWVAYKPVVIAYNVNTQTVAQIETHSVELEGMSIAESTVRIYPRETVAAHTIGYMSKMVDEETLDKMTDLGYNVDDLIGVTGIEAFMEPYLSGNSARRQGKQVVKIDNMAVVQEVLSSTESTQGDNVILTINTPLQLALEESLAKNIPKIKQDQIDLFNLDENGDYKDIASVEDVDLAESGAAVVMDVNTGDVLAMGSYPSFDLNIFTGGIDYDLAQELYRDPSTPLFNKAVSSRGTPGSIFKMVTGLGGLMEGELTLTEEIDDEGPYDVYTKPNERAPRCWTRNILNHQNQTIEEGLKNSCNYFFYTVADRLGIGRLNDWGDRFGLTSLTGIELPEEVKGYIASQDTLYNNEYDEYSQKSSIAILVKKKIIETIHIIEEERDVIYEDDIINTTADELLYLAGVEWTNTPEDETLRDENGSSMGDHVRSILFQYLKVPENISESRGWKKDITDYISELRWTPTLTLTTGIGQSVTRITPVAVARYVSAIVNGGTVYEAHVVDKVIRQDGTLVYDQEPVVFNILGAPDDYLNAIKQGMKDVVNEGTGTAAKYFKDFKYKDIIGGKTGTAEVSDIDLENNSWFVCFAPFEEPEIAVVVYVPHGYSGGWSSGVAKDILEYYIDDSKLVAMQTIPQANTLLLENNLLVAEETEDEEQTTDSEQ